ncbi:transposase, partial [Paraburkholderia caribensis]|uniref:transposase n=1 Tax=Paraburkholderia caribensis TaxID=75105 RepID=UPI0020915495
LSVGFIPAVSNKAAKAMRQELRRKRLLRRSDLELNDVAERTARAWLYREQLREILERKQIHVVSEMLQQWCTNVMRSKVEPMKDVARLIRRHFDG